MNIIRKIINALLVSTLILSVNLSHATPPEAINIASQPLIVSSVVEPNLMLLMDTSGSMKAIVEDYDDTKTYGVCPSNLVLPRISNNRWIKHYFSVDNNGYPFFRYSGKHWGLSGNRSCFDKDARYYISLNNESTFKTYYNGNYLNYYFSNANQTNVDRFGVGALMKPGTVSRQMAGINALKNLVGTTDDNGINNMNIALAGFNNYDNRSNASRYYGATILSPLDDVDNGNHRRDLISAIEDLGASGGTPLASAASAIGRYFSIGTSPTYKISDSAKPFNNNSSTFNTNNKELFYSDGLKGPLPTRNVIQYSCQKNFMIALTDGEPSSDVNYHNILGAWDDGSVGGSNDFDDVLGALHDIDFRPDYTDGDADEISNLISYVIGFAIDFPLLERAAALGGGEYFTANNSAQLNASLAQATKSLLSKVGSVGAVTFSSAHLQSETTLFSATYNTGDWSGDLKAYTFTQTGEVASSPEWSASEKLNAMPHSDRNIMAYNDSTKTGVEFTYENLSGSALEQDLLSGPDINQSGGASDAADAALLLDYIRGDKSNEGILSHEYRSRDNLLGDIIDSSPFYIAKPNEKWPDYNPDHTVTFGSASKNYSKFKEKYKDRKEVIYVGANDGMLHGFSASVTSTPGKELFAYIPSAIASTDNNSGLHYLANQSYSHSYSVDDSPIARDVFIKSRVGGTKDWRTILVGGLRAGGRGIYALDVTDPDDFDNLSANADNIALWEFTNNDDPNLGYTYATPSIVKLNNKKWGVILGNGYNSGGSGTAQVFILFISKGINGEWRPGKDYIVLDTLVGSETIPNGLSATTIADLDNNGTADRIYAGDLEGNMWVFDISSDRHRDWETAYGSKVSPEPLFSAINEQGQKQPITIAPTITLNSKVMGQVGNLPNISVLFGTGRYLQADDVANYNDTMSFYSVWDSGKGNITRDGNSKNRGELKERAFKTQAADGTRSMDDAASKNEPIIYETTIAGQEPDYGWFIDLPETGERVLSKPRLRGGSVFFQTQTPSNAICESGGTSWLMVMDVNTGKYTSPPSFDANGDGHINSGDFGFVGVQMDQLVFATNIMEDQEIYLQDDEIETRHINEDLQMRSGVLSWFEYIKDW